MRRGRFVAMMAAGAVILAACGSTADTTVAATQAPDPTVEPTEPPEETTTTSEAEPTTTSESPDTSMSDTGIPDENEDLADISTATFSDPLTIDNPYLPIVPGMQLVYEGITVEDGEELSHRIVFTVTDLIKVVDGVPSAVRWDRDFSEGELVEAELAFFAQDDDGNVWHMGEYPEEYEDGEMVDNPGWLAGVEDALAGYQMKADPQPGTPSYSQGWGPEVDWTDRGQIDEIGLEFCVEAGCYTDILSIAEWALDEREFGVQLKFYAPEVGNISVSFRGDDANQEELELVEIIMLDEAGLAEAREEALALEASAYDNSEMYSESDPLEQR